MGNNENRLPDFGAAPNRDGQVTEYISGEAQGTRWFNHGRKVLFINGMANSGENHRASALALSLLQMCPVVGVFNQSGGFVLDLGQCIADKYQFHGPAARSPQQALDKAMDIESKKVTIKKSRAEIMESILERNSAGLAMFRTARRPDYRQAPIFAHSQGNLILSNALSAVAAVDGAQAIQGREIYTFGSPAVNWPSGVQVFECGFTWDPVTWLAGFDTSFSISKVGWPSGSKNPITHGFEWYVNHDPAFVVNRFRWGSFGITVSMDEEGLAKALVAMGTNMPRVRKIFEHLRDKHSSDADDVALLYVQKIQAAANSNSILQAIKADSDLRALLMQVMEEGWTSGEERKAIDLLKAL